MRIKAVRSTLARCIVSTITGLSILCLSLVGATVWAAERNEACPTALLPAIEDFLCAVSRVSLIDPVEDRSQRVYSYELAAKRLIQEARRFYGPFCPCSEILRDAWAFIDNAERTRTPPPSWEPKPGPENLVLNTDVARRSIMLQMRVSAWGWTMCTYR
jgi:hypothetical protein